MTIHKLPDRDPLVVAREWYRQFTTGKKYETDIVEIREALDVLRQRLAKVRNLFPEYKQLSFGDDISHMMQIDDYHRASSA